jgi:hypothetical protein
MCLPTGHCVRACVRARVRACVRARVRACVRMCYTRRSASLQCLDIRTPTSGSKRADARASIRKHKEYAVSIRKHKEHGSENKRNSIRKHEEHSHAIEARMRARTHARIRTARSAGESFGPLGKNVLHSFCPARHEIRECRLEKSLRPSAFSVSSSSLMAREITYIYIYIYAWRVNQRAIIAPSD